MTNLKTILITGSNRGIGLELVKESLSKNFSVIGTFRNKENSQELFQLSSNNIKLFEMDVVDEKSVLDVSKNIHNPIDYLICNAGINNGYGSIFDQDHTHEKMLEVLNVNVIGSILTVKHFSKILNKDAKIILISSIMGVQNHSGSSASIYRASKAAVNNIMISISEEFKSKKITVASFHPGWVRTDMGGPNATLSTKESASSLIKNFENLTFENTGKFFNYDGTMMNF
jgi:NAD(P)-dependent dehydrogenase (short-subunit alcohol dehydrogenase family)|tara:strand:+ start:590 stop:1276 length:687 start_codon:yes stop_codon:yes gene_type:complete